MFNPILFSNQGEREEALLVLTIDTNLGTGLTFILPVRDSGLYEVKDWGDGTSSVSQLNDSSKTYATHGIYTIVAKFNTGAIFFAGNAENAKKLIAINQWSVKFNSLFGSFSGCINLINLPSIQPIRMPSISMQSMLSFTKINQSLNHWDMSMVLSIASLLNGVSTYNQNIDWTDVSIGTINVTNISSAFTNTKMSSIKMQAGSITTTSANTFSSNTNLTEIILINMSASFFIFNVPTVIGSKINDLANSVKDMTGLTSPTITMTAAQKASCNQSLWTSKNWIIA